MKRHFAAWLLTLAAGSTWAADWKLAWSDEFDKPGLPDPAKWNYEQGFIRNNEAQYYTRGRMENARVEGGMLIIEARKERIKNAAFDPAASDRRWRQHTEFADYSSASLTTKDKFSWTYGRIEVRAKLPKARGTWPAIWMLGTNSNRSWPACGEIDIMEFVGYAPGIVHANVHTLKYNHVTHNGKGSQITIPDASDAFHIYAMEWDPEKLDFFVDGKKYFTYENEHSGTDAWPFDKDQYLILNLAIGGAWGGQKGIDESAFPQMYYVDYVRIYQKPGAATTASAQ